MSDIPPKPHWDNPVEFILACVGFAIGLGNIWRFPFLCYRNGGGAFLLPFLIAMLVLGLPLLFLELYVGQYSGLGPVKAFAAIAPAFSGLGYCCLAVISILSTYYMIVVSWSLFYLIITLFGSLTWGNCDDDFNTDYCYSVASDIACRKNNTGKYDDLTYYQGNCTTIAKICEETGLKKKNGTFCLFNNTIEVPFFANLTRVLAAEEYFNGYVLGRGDSDMQQYGYIQWHLVGCLAFSWFLAFLCIIKGVKSEGKVAYFTAVFPYIMLTALLIRAVTLEGSAMGLTYYMYPDWSQLLVPQVWGDAASQIFYSFGICSGTMITLASYNAFNRNCHFNTILVSAINFFTSLYAGVVIFAVLGFQANVLGVEIDDVAQSGPGLAFVAFPEALLRMRHPRIWSILFFSMVYILGLGSQFAGIEAINTAIAEKWPELRRHYWMITAATCILYFILGLPMCFSGGVYLLTLLDWNTATWAILMIGLAECVSVAWCYGVNNVLNDLESMEISLNVVLQQFWKWLWTIITPICCFLFFIFVLWNLEPPAFEDYEYPDWAKALGFLVGLSTIIFMPIVMVWVYFYDKVELEAMFTPTSEWTAAS